MGITVGHDVSAATLADAAFSIGKGEKNVREQARADETSRFNAQMEQRARESAQQNALQAASLSQRNRLANEELTRRDQEFEFEKQKYQQDRVDAFEVLKLQMQNRLDSIAARNPGFFENIALRNSLEASQEPEYTPAQQRRIDEIKGMQSWVWGKVATGEWTDTEASQVLSQASAELETIVPTNKAQPSGTRLEQMWASLNTIDAQSGDRWMLNKDKWENISAIERKEKLEAQDKMMGHFIDFVKMSNEQADMSETPRKNAAELRKEFAELTGERVAEPEQSSPPINWDMPLKEKVKQDKINNSRSSMADYRQGQMQAEQPQAAEQAAQGSPQEYLSRPDVPFENKRFALQKFPELQTPDNVLNVYVKAAAMGSATKEEKIATVREAIKRDFPEIYAMMWPVEIKQKPSEEKRAERSRPAIDIPGILKQKNTSFRDTMRQFHGQ